MLFESRKKEIKCVFLMPQDMALLSLFPWSDWVVQPSRTGMLMFNFNAITVDKKIFNPCPLLHGLSRIVKLD